MSTLLEQLNHLLASERPVCYTALVETRGSTPQKSGATMLLLLNGNQLGTLGGGCVEAEVKQRSLQRILTARQSGSSDPAFPDSIPAELMSFQLDSNYGWDDGLICGGRMKMLVVPVLGENDRPYFQVLRNTIAVGLGCTEVVVLEPEKAAGGHSGDQILLDASGQVIAARTESKSSTLPQKIAESLRPLVERPRPYVANGLSFLPHLPRCRLIIVGAGHVGQKVAALAAEVEFEVWVVDDRDDYCRHERFPRVSRLIVDAIGPALKGLPIDSSTYCIIVTRGHHHDQQALQLLANSGARYLGMIGSRRKIKLIFDNLIQEGISREILEQVYAPLGLDIGSQTVDEIAISIVAELISHRNLGSLPERLRLSRDEDQINQ